MIDIDVDKFIQIRDYILEHLEEKVSVFFTGIWDPLCKHVLIKEVYEVVDREIIDLFPDFPAKYIPKLKFKIDDENLEIEVLLQMFLNTDTKLIFLANIDIGAQNYDLYCRKSWDPRFEYVFFARFGNDVDSIIKGSKTAAAEYFMGKYTPLSLAYHVALEEGFVS